MDSSTNSLKYIDKGARNDILCNMGIDFITVECLYKDGHFFKKFAVVFVGEGTVFPKVCRSFFKNERFSNFNLKL